MKIADGFILRNIHGINYLLPYGQNIALNKNSIHLNDTGALLWNALQQGMEENDLLSLLMRHYKTDSTDITSLQSDFDYFIQQLTSFHLLTTEEPTAAYNKYFKIGNIVIGYQGPESLLHPSLLDFTCEPDIVGQSWSILSDYPDPFPLGELMIRTSEIEILRNDDDYVITLFSSLQPIQIRISLDGTRARFYCRTPFSASLAEQLFHAFRHVYLFYAQKRGVFALHSSSILYRDKVWLISAPSGTGKSTLADFWHEQYQTPILNGDLNLISIDGAQPIVWGLPWCGTSRIYTTASYPLGGIILLKKHAENQIVELTEAEQQLSVTQRLISPVWTNEMLDFNLIFTGKLIEYIPVFRYLCRKEPAAAQILRQYIDKLPI